jgi:crotonobetainyl-CoA:carnitine CoA-transferase CaiB-like acyl-CoA transferase
VPYGVFDTRDGSIVIAAYNDKFWQRLARCLDRPDLAEDPRFATADGRAANRDDCIASVRAVTMQRTTDELLGQIEAADVPCAPVLDLREALEHPHSRTRGVVVTQETEAGELAMLASSIRFPLEERTVFTIPPRLGQDTESVLREVAGYGDAELGRLRPQRQS